MSLDNAFFAQLLMPTDPATSATNAAYMVPGDWKYPGSDMIKPLGWYIPLKPYYAAYKY